MADGSGFHGTGRVPRGRRRQVTDRVPVRVTDANGRPREGAVVDLYIGGYRTERTKEAIENDAAGPEATVAYAQHGAGAARTGGNGITSLPPAQEWEIENTGDRFEETPGSAFDPITPALPEAVDPLDRPYETQATLVAAYPGPDSTWFGTVQVPLVTVLESTTDKPVTVTLRNERLLGPRPLTADIELPDGRTALDLQYGAVTAWRSVPPAREVGDGRHHLYVEITSARQLARLSGQTPATDEGPPLYADFTGDSVFESNFPTVDALGSFDPVPGVFGPPADSQGPVTPPALSAGSVTLYVTENAATVPGRNETGTGRNRSSRTADGPWVLDRENADGAAFARATSYAFADRGAGVLGGEGYAAPLYPHLRWAFREWQPSDRANAPSPSGLLSLFGQVGGPAAETGKAFGKSKLAVQFVNGVAGQELYDPDAVKAGDETTRLTRASEGLGKAATAVGLLTGTADVLSELKDEPLKPDNRIGGGLELTPNETEEYDASWAFTGSGGRSSVVIRLPILFETDRLTVGIEGGWTSEVELYPPSGTNPIRQQVVERLRSEAELANRRTPGSDGDGDDGGGGS